MYKGQNSYQISRKSVVMRMQERTRPSDYALWVTHRKVTSLCKIS